MQRRRKVKFVMLVMAAAVVCLAGVGLWVKSEMPHHTPGTPKGIESSGDKTLDAIRRGIEFLKAHQEEDGFFVAGRLTPKPAYTALVVDALMRSPDKYSPENDPFMQKAVEAILSTRRENGGLYTGVPGMTFANYSTALSVVALQRVGDPAYEAVIADAVEFLKRGQFVGEENDANTGGFGYSGPEKPDLNNTVIAIEALKEAGVPEDDPVYARVREFASKCQNRSESNPLKWAGNDGGFVYRPGDSPAGEEMLPDGGKGYKSYGAMTSAGLIAFLYSNTDKDDPRVKSAFDWIQKNYDLNANINVGDKGLYYYYRTMAKALAAYGDPVIVTPDGTKHRWAEDMAKTLLAMQRPDGSWVNKNTSYLEGDAILVTAYAVRTLSICYAEMNKSESEDDTQ